MVIINNCVLVAIIMRMVHVMHIYETYFQLFPIYRLSYILYLHACYRVGVCIQRREYRHWLMSMCQWIKSSLVGSEIVNTAAQCQRWGHR